MSSPLLTKRFVLSFVVGYVLLINTEAYVLRQFHFPFNIVITESLVSVSLLLFASLLVLNITRYYLSTSYLYAGALSSSLVISLLWLFITNSLLKIIFSDYEAYLYFLHNSLIFRFVFAFLILAIVTAASILWYHWQERQKEAQRKSEVVALSREAELFKLRQQLQPHFLFNSLNSINALIELDPLQARKMVQQLSDFLRGTLKKEESQMIALEEEINYLNLYLEIEKVRFGNRLQTKIDMGDGCREALLPTLLLQPVVENAIKFGLYDLTGQTLITIRCTFNKNELIVRIENPFDPEISLPRTGTGFGLTSIKRRLYLLYGRNDLLKTSIQGSIFETMIKIPQHYEQSDHN